MEKFREQEQRFTAYREKLEYGVYHVIADLAIEAYITEEPAAFSERESGRHMAPKPGDHWGDLFDCGWFHFTGRVPKEAWESHADSAYRCVRGGLWWIRTAILCRTYQRHLPQRISAGTLGQENH